MQPQRPAMPLFSSPNGVGKLSISQVEAGRTSFQPLLENSWAFTDLASAIDIGLQILESPPGRAALADLGLLLVQTWRAENHDGFQGSRPRMITHVQNFLAAIRNDFPSVGVVNLGSPAILASAERIENFWDGEFRTYRPKFAVNMRYNHQRVCDMITASAAVDNPDYDRNNPPTRAQIRVTRKVMLQRHKQFQFMFASATAHELCHAFVGYLSGNGLRAEMRTPPRVSHLDYGRQQASRQGNLSSGESGRWFENRLFGGSLEFYYFPQDGTGQPGRAYVLDNNEMAWRVDPLAIERLVETSRALHFPLQRVPSSGLSRQQRAEKRVRSIGATSQGAVATATQLLFMRARTEKIFRVYDVSQTELNRVHADPDRIQRVRPVLVGS